MGTRQEITGKRDISFSRWIREMLPCSSDGHIVNDIDFFIYNYKSKECCLVEVKTRNAVMRFPQREMYEKLISPALSMFMPVIGWKFKGFYFIQFTNTFFDDGDCRVNGELVTEDELRRILSFNSNYNESKHHRREI